MKKGYVHLLSLTMTIFIITALLCGCGSISSGDLIGVWSSSWEYEGKQFNSSVQFERNGDYSIVTYCNGELSSTEQGTYVIEGNKVNCQINGNAGAITPFKYSGGKLVNGDHSYSKENG